MLIFVIASHGVGGGPPHGRNADLSSCEDLLHKSIFDHLIDIAQILLLHIGGNKIAEPAGGQRPILQCAIEDLAAEAAVLDRLH